MTAAADGKIYIGSEAGYGAIGGALSVLDPATDTLTELHRFSTTTAVSEGVASIDTVGNKLYLGTTLGNLFEYDIAAHTMGPAQSVGTTTVSSVRVSPQGNVYVSNISGVVKMYVPGTGFTFSVQAVPDIARGSIIGKTGTST